jgi:hypothetical protein
MFAIEFLCKYVATFESAVEIISWYSLLKRNSQDQVCEVVKKTKYADNMLSGYSMITCYQIT